MSAQPTAVDHALATYTGEVPGMQRPDYGVVTDNRTAHWDGKQSPIYACEVVSWEDPYENPAHWEGIRGKCIDWLKTARVHREVDPWDGVNPPYEQVECNELFVCIVEDRLTAEEMELEISDTLTGIDQHGERFDVEVYFEVRRVICRQDRRVYTAVIGRVNP